MTFCVRMKLLPRTGARYCNHILRHIDQDDEITLLIKGEKAEFWRAACRKVFKWVVTILRF